MDDQSFERWSEKLTNLRKKRQRFIDENIENRADSFSPNEFYTVSMDSLNEVMDAWFEFEQQSWTAKPPSDPVAEIERLRGEMESVLDFEVEAVDRDRSAVLVRISWDEATLKISEPAFQTFIDDLRNKFQLKVKGLANSGGPSTKKRALEQPLPQVSQAGGSSRGGNGLGLFFMFLIGLLLGGGPSFVFHESAKKAERQFQEDRSKMLSEQHAVADSMVVLHDSFEQLATGKLDNIPELNRKIAQAQSSINQERDRIRKTHDRAREQIMKRVPAGNKQDAALEEADAKFAAQTEDLKKQEASVVNPLVKQRDLLKDLVSR